MRGCGVFHGISACAAPVNPPTPMGSADRGSCRKMLWCGPRAMRRCERSLSRVEEDESMSDTNRRSLLARAVALTTMGALAGSALVRSKARAQSAAGTGTNGVRALVFDVFGTVVDWRGGAAGVGQVVLKPRGYALDWIAFADA